MPPVGRSFELLPYRYCLLFDIGDRYITLKIRTLERLPRWPRRTPARFRTSRHPEIGGFELHAIAIAVEKRGVAPPQLLLECVQPIGSVGQFDREADIGLVVGDDEFRETGSA